MERDDYLKKTDHNRLHLITLYNTERRITNMNKSLTIAYILIIGRKQTIVLDNRSTFDTLTILIDVKVYSNAYGDNIETIIHKLTIDQFLTLILDDTYNTDTQTTYIFPIHYDNSSQRSEVSALIDGMYVKHGYKYQYILSSQNKQPNYESEHMITLSKFFTLTNKKLDLRRFPKSKVKQTGLACLPKTGNYRKWYIGITKNTDGEKKVSWLPYLSGEAVSLEDRVLTEVKELNGEQQRTLSSIGQQWNIDEFQHARQPIDIASVNNRFAFQNPMPNVVNLPIKLAGSNKMYLPKEYEGMEEALSKIIAYEKSVNPNYDNNYAYLTIDKNYVRAGSSQSRFIYHVDGYQSAEHTDYDVQRNYTVTDIVPTEFVVSPLETKGLAGDTVLEWFDSFTHQSQHVDKMETIPLHIYHYDGYQVHTPTLAMATTDKTSLHVSFTSRQLNGLGNGINPLIDEEWTYLLTHLDSEVTVRGEAI